MRAQIPTAGMHYCEIDGKSYVLGSWSYDITTDAVEYRWMDADQLVRDSEMVRRRLAGWPSCV